MRCRDLDALREALGHLGGHLSFDLTLTDHVTEVWNTHHVRVRPPLTRSTEQEQEQEEQEEEQEEKEEEQEPHIISSTFMPGPLLSIILDTYCFTASVTFMTATSKQQQQQQQQHSSSCGVRYGPRGLISDIS
ncbi:hypothetical protein EYF80_061221 [Liparis tanakae]|uniref:Uncharacterized protein n=1 Tax=Liparis tanakae TaxID=230148 RepID=A0A4Z2EJ28_9TELE|nr:hypothetical protein EYF80_061221 [Liparis tanakae]